MTVESVWQQLSDRGVAVPPQLTACFDEHILDVFLAFLHERNQEGGFFSAADGERILERHLFESLVMVEHLTRLLPITATSSVADVGSGPGLPGFLFCALKESPHVTLIDSSRRRLGLVEKHLAGVVEPPPTFLYRRAEEVGGVAPAGRPGKKSGRRKVAGKRGGRRAESTADDNVEPAGHNDEHTFDLVTARAFVPFPFSVELVCRMVAPGGYLALATAGLPEAPPNAPQLSELGFEVTAAVPLEELAFLGERHILLLRRVSRPARVYPRMWSVIQSEIRRARG